MSVRTYSPSVRVGNWNEDIALQEDTLKDFLEKKENGQLLMQRTQGVMAGATQPVTLSNSPDGVVHFGDRVMLVNKASSERGDCVLSLNMTAESLMSDDPTAVPPTVSGCLSVKPSTRNLFVVTSPNGMPNGEPLQYNQPFYLCLPSGNGNLYLKSEASTFQNSSKKARHNCISLVGEPSFSTQFEVCFFDPRLRLEFEHHPVPANERVVITHQKTNEALAVEAAHKLRTAFGWEFEVSCHTYLDSHKAEEDTNHWMFVMNVPGKEYNPAPVSR